MRSQFSESRQRLATAAEENSVTGELKNMVESMATRMAREKQENRVESMARKVEEKMEAVAAAVVVEQEKKERVEA